MTTQNRSLKDSLSQATGTFGKDIVSIMYCTVDTVDEDAKTCDCTPISGVSDASIPGVLLNSESNDGITLYPEIGSTIIVGLSVTNTAFMILAEDLSKIQIVIGESTLEITDALFKFNGGDNDGMVLINALVTQINKLENKVNDIVNGFTAHVHTGGTISGSTGPTVTTFTPPLTPTEKADIENTKITQ